MERIVGLLFSGFVIRLAGAALALWIGLEVTGEAFELLDKVAKALP